MFKYLSNFFKRNNKYEDNLEVLEYIPKDIFHQIDTDDYNENNSLFISIKNFCKKHNEKGSLIVSLSGGVDSMVLISIIKYLGYYVIALHINYNNRTESIKEQKFIETWCAYNNIKLYVKEITHIKRNDCKKRGLYEAVTKEIRFKFYNEILKKEKLNSILLGHHKDDIVENVFANVCRSRFILDLAVIREQNIINNINICRPMIKHYKKDIYDFAHKYDIPYFKDTTPDWCVRGKYRKIIAPAIEDAFSENVKNNLIELGQQSDEWNTLVNKIIIDPFLNEIIYNEKSINFNVKKYIDYPFCFWLQIFMRLFYKYNHNCPSRKSIQNFLNILIIQKNCNILISNKTICKLRNNWVYIEFI